MITSRQMAVIKAGIAFKHRSEVLSGKFNRYSYNKMLRHQRDGTIGRRDERSARMYFIGLINSPNDDDYYSTTAAAISFRARVSRLGRSKLN